MRLTKDQLVFLQTKKYLHEGETIEQRLDSIFNAVRKYEEQYQEVGFADRVREWVDNKYISLSTPQIANVGRHVEDGAKTQPLPCSCNIIGVDDSIDSIYKGIHEAAMLSKLGGGVGANFHKVSDGGTLLEQAFTTNPKLDWVEDYVRTGQKVSQNNVRRGYVAPYDSIESNHFWDYMNRLDKNNPDKKDPLVNNTFGIILPAGFWERFKGDKELQKRYLYVMQQRRLIGRIYILDVDNCNKNQSPVYEILRHEVNSSNICCVTGDQLVATEDGFKTVKELSDTNKPLMLFDNEGIHPSSAMVYRGYWDTFKVTLKNGMSHIITSNHELIVKENEKGVRKSIDTGLAVGDKVAFQTKKGLFGNRNEAGVAFLLGLFLGDGNQQNQNGTRISLWEKDFDLIPEIEDICEDVYKNNTDRLHFNSRLPKFVEGCSGDSSVGRKNLHTTMFNRCGLPFKKGEIPNWILESDEETQWQLIRGLLYADGTVGDYNKGKSFGTPITLSLGSIDIKLLEKLQIICANLGLGVKIYKMRESGIATLPKNDGTGGQKEYNTKTMFRLVLSNKNDLLELERNTGFLSRKNVTIEDREYRDNSQKFSKVVSIEPEGKQDVYCPTVDSDKHLWVCNGFITSNTEAITPNYTDKTFACMLLSLNLKHWDVIKENPQIIRDAYILLDIFVQMYIDLGKHVPAISRAIKSAKEKRDIGLGTVGFHDYLQSKMMTFGGLESRWVNKEIYSTIRRVGEDYTKEFGERLGSPKMCQEAGLVRRNVSLMMVAPNKSTSFFMDTSEGINPWFNNYGELKLAGIEATFKNWHLEPLLKERGKNTVEVWDSILDNLGSVQHLDFLTDHEKEVFKTAPEISPKDIIDLASDRQKFIDMGQSINLWTRPNYTDQDIYNIHKYAWSKDIKTLYYVFPQSHAALEKDGGKPWDDCASCAD